MLNPLSDLTQQLLDYAAKAGADQADAIAVDGTSVSIDVRGGALEHAERSEGIDIGLRVMVGQRQACVSSSDTKPDTLREMADPITARLICSIPAQSPTPPNCKTTPRRPRRQR